MERKLAAILSADVVGYSRLMGADEDTTIEALRSNDRLIETLTAAYRGRIFNTAGDSVVTEFPSAVEATLCAIEIQREIGRRNVSVPFEKRFQLRIGINIGDVVAEGGNLFGDGVNIADRIQKLAEPGGVLVSRNVREQLASKPEFRLESLGERRVKNIAAPISVYRVLIGDPSGPASIGRWLLDLRYRSWRIFAAAIVLLVGSVGLTLWRGYPAGSESRDFPSVAVLDFQNLSLDPALDAFIGGFADNLATAISGFPTVSVRSHSSGLSGGNVEADELGVDYLVEGSVQKQGGGVRINAQLIDVDTDMHVWAQNYDTADQLELQDVAVGRIANSLASESGAIIQHEYKRTAGKAHADFSEYEYFLSGHEIFVRFANLEEHERAGAVWRDGLERYPNSTLLRVSLAWYYFFRPWDFATDRPADDYRQAGELARKALSEPRGSPFVRWSGRKLMAYIHWFENNFEQAVADAEASVEAAPHDADTLSFLSRVQVASGNTARALEWTGASIDLQPSIQRNTRILAWIYYLRGDYEKSIEAGRRHQELSRQFGGDASFYVVASYVRLGRMMEARAALKQALQAEPQWTQLKERNNQLARPYKDPELFERQMADLGAAGLPELPLGFDGNSSDRLSAEDIKALTFGHTFRAEDTHSGATFTDVIALDGTIETTGVFGQDTGSLVYLNNSLICYLWRETGPNCAAIFRIPAKHSVSGYTLVDALGEYRYTMVR